MLKPARRVLYITSFHPGASGYIGAGEAISAQTLQRLRQEGAEVHVLAIAPRYQRRNAAAESWCESYREVATSRVAAVAGILRHLFSGAALAPAFFTRTAPAAVAAVQAAIVEHEPSEVWIDFPSSLGFAQHVGPLPVHYFVHDVVSQKVARSPIKRRLFPWAARVESALLSHVQHCYLLSNKDEQLLRDLHFNGPAEVWGVQGREVGEVDNGRPIASVVAEFGCGPNLVFFGNMGRPENSRSMVHFALRQWWQVRRAFPGAQLWIIGLAPGLLLRTLGKLIHGLKVTGPVDDPIPAFRAASVCIAPLLFGAGVKIKVLQMLDAGATVIATPVGAEGIEPSAHLIVVPSSALAAQVVVYLQGIERDDPQRFQQVQ